MILIKGLVALYVAMSGVAFFSSAWNWAFSNHRGSAVLMAASGFLFAFWGSILAFLASR